MKNSVDIVVLGAGAAGLAAAISAARTGASVILIDRRNGPGGTGGFSGLTTLCGLYDEAGKFLNEGFAREFAEQIAEAPAQKQGRVWALPYRPEKFRSVAASLLEKTPNLQTHWGESLKTLRVEGGRITQLNDAAVGAVIDCSGDAEIGAAAGADLLSTDDSTQASAVVFALRGVAREIGTPAEAAQVLLPIIRAGFPSLNFHPDLEPGGLTVKFSGRPEQVPALIDCLRKNVRGFENCSATQTHFSVSRRAGRMIVGKHLLTGAEVLAAKKFSDAIARCAWPVEQWSADGKTKLRWLPPGECYEIPSGALRCEKIENLFMAGKTISADVDAIASARVMGCCLATGEAAGKMAAKF